MDRMPKTSPDYPEQYRRLALELVCQGRSIPDVAASLGSRRRRCATGSVRTSASVASATTGSPAPSARSCVRRGARTAASGRSATFPSAPWLCSRGTPRPGECVPAHLGGESPLRASGLRDVRRLAVPRLGVGPATAVGPPRRPRNGSTPSTGTVRALRRVSYEHLAGPPAPSGAPPSSPQPGCGARRSARVHARPAVAAASRVREIEPVHEKKQLDENPFHLFLGLSG
jgi:hypothetical protein